MRLVSLRGFLLAHPPPPRSGAGPCTFVPTSVVFGAETLGAAGGAAPPRRLPPASTTRVLSRAGLKSPRSAGRPSVTQAPLPSGLGGSRFRGESAAAVVLPRFYVESSGADLRPCPSAVSPQGRHGEVLARARARKGGLKGRPSSLRAPFNL